MARFADGVGKRRGARRLAKELIVGACSADDAGESFGRTKELSPALGHRRRIAPVRLVLLGDVPVVEYGRRRWKCAHARNLAAGGGGLLGPGRGLTSLGGVPGHRDGPRE